MGSHYEYAVVGHPSRLYLWILSRTPTLDSSVMSGVLARARPRHFDTSQLEFTPQPPAGERNDLTAAGLGAAGAARGLLSRRSKVGAAAGIGAASALHLRSPG